LIQLLFQLCQNASYTLFEYFLNKSNKIIMFTLIKIHAFLQTTAFRICLNGSINKIAYSKFRLF